MRIRPIGEDELGAVADWLAREQTDPARHIAYLALDAGAIATGLRQLEPDGLGGAVVAVDDGGVVGFLAAEHDTEPPRVWWHGPYVRRDHDFQEVADALYEAAGAHLPDHVVEQELAPDDRHADVAAFAARHGFAAEEASAVLVRTLHADDDPDRRDAGAAPPGVTVERLDDVTSPAVAELHDATFRGTHRSGASLTSPAEGQLVLVARRGREVVGYVAVEQQDDGSGYVDYLGVAADERRNGRGRALVAAGCARLRDELDCTTVSLTVRESNVAARRLYDQLGFAEERLIRPWRRGFTLAAS